MASFWILIQTLTQVVIHHEQSYRVNYESHHLNVDKAIHQLLKNLITFVFMYLSFTFANHWVNDEWLQDLSYLSNEIKSQ